MQQLFMALFLSAVGFILLGFGAHFLVTNAATIARKLGLSARLIGLTIVAAGTSIPEITVALRSSIIRHPGLAVGDAIGSNIVNVGLILGLTTLIVPLEIRSDTLQREWPILLLVMLIVGLLMLDGRLGHVDGALLLLGGISVIFWLVQQGVKNGIFHPDVLTKDYKKTITAEPSMLKASGFLVLGLALLPVSSYIIVSNAIFLANYFHVHDVIIGLTVSALGTSLPELATSLTAARRKEYDMVIGNILGSNTFNLLIVLALPAVIRTVSLETTLIRDYVTMFVLISLLFICSFRFNGVKCMSRVNGGVMLSIYIVYLLSVYFLH
jgi:cation:H+ antiporter